MYKGLSMHYVRAISGVLVLWATSAWGATLTWEANSEPDLAGYRIYRCPELPCTVKKGAAPVAKVGKNETSVNVGTPDKIQYYFVTALNSANQESGASNVVVVKPASLSADLTKDTVKGTLMRMDGENYWVRDTDGKEVRLHVDGSTKLDKVMKGDRVKAFVTDSGHTTMLQRDE